MRQGRTADFYTEEANLLFKCLALNIWNHPKCPYKGYWHFMVSLPLGSQVVFRITSLGCCATGSFPEIIVWRSLLDWCISLISKNTFPSVLSIVYPFTVIIIITLFIWAPKSMFAFCFGQGGEKIPNGFYLGEWGGVSGRYMDVGSLGMWIILAKIFENISHHFSCVRRIKASWISVGGSHLPGTRVLGGPDFCTILFL